MKTTNGQVEPQAPTRENLAALLGRCRPEVESLFQRHSVSREEADELLDETLATLLLRWDRIDDPASWLLAVLSKAIRCRLLLPLFGESAQA